MRFRPRSIRARTFFLVLTPLVSLVALYIYTATAAAENSISLAHATDVRNSIADPTGLFAAQVQQERLAAATYLARPSASGESALSAQEQRTNASLSTLRTAVASVEGDEAPSVRSAISLLLQQAAGMPGLRAKVSSNSLSPAAAEQDYTAVITLGYQAIAASFEQLPDVALVTESAAVLRVAEAEDELLQAQTLFAADAAAGSFPAADRAQFATLTGSYQGLFSEALSDLGPDYRAPFENVAKSSDAVQLNSLDAQVLTAPPSETGPLAAKYGPVAQSVALGLATASFTAGQTLATALKAAAGPLTLRLIVTAGAGLGAILISIVLSFWIGRGIIRELAGLRREALELARRRLPRVMALLSSGEIVDVDAEAPSMTVGPDEIGQVRQAFNIVQRAAIRAGAEQAALRSGVATVFRNLAMRSQSLLQQQLQLLDTLEQRADGPEELERLFQIDHLATRMRRNAEGLLVLAGEQPGRTWTEPVQMVDVLRGSVAEVVDYARVRVICPSGAALMGHAVADVIHLIAELTENATGFSPPQNKVRVSGSEVVQGFAVEVEDQGIGIPPEQAEHLNAILADPPPFNPAESDHLGVYVAARLAQRHGIRITLRVSPYGGTVAIVLIPGSLMVSDDPQGRGQLPDAGQLGLGAAPQAALQQAALPQAAHPQAAHPQAAHPQAADRQAAYPRAADRQGTDRRAEPQAGDWQGANWQGAERQGGADRRAERQGADWQGAERQPLVSAAADTSSPEDPDAMPGRQATRDTPARDMPARGVLRGMRGRRPTGRPVSPPRAPENVASIPPAPARRGPAFASTASGPELPRRVRQTNLPPQLRKGVPTTGRPVDHDHSLDPDLAKAISAALADIQSGMERGNSESLDIRGSRSVGPAS
jgi:signal transduction histidine kinase